MKLRTSALAGVALAIGFSNLAVADGETALPGHPGDNSNPTAAAAAPLDPFSLGVPPLDRDEPAPSYAKPAPAPSNDPAAPTGASMEGMDHSSMPGMNH